MALIPLTLLQAIETPNPDPQTTTPNEFLFYKTFLATFTE